MKRYIRSSIDKEEILQIARTTSDMQELYDLIDNKEVRNMYLQEVGEQIAKNPNLTDDFIKHVFFAPAIDKPAYTSVRYQLMKSPLVSTDILKAMVYSDDFHLRSDAARSPHLTVEMMKHLSKDTSSYVISLLAENPKLPEYLMRDMYYGKRVEGYYLARNPNAPLDLLEEILNDKDSDADTREAARKAIKRRTGKDPSKSKRKSPWMILLYELQSEAEDGIDSLYEQTSAGDKIESLCAAVQRKLGVWLEPSIQGGIGSIMFYSTKDDSVLGDDYDYQEYNEEVLDLAFNSKTQREFQTKYKQFLQSIIA